MSAYETSIRAARQYMQKSYRTFKVKVGLNLSEELRLVAAVRDIIGPDRRLFIDANQGWRTPERAVDAIQQFERYGIAWVEQPIAKTDLDGLRYVKDHVSTPIMADESLFSPQDAQTLLSRQAVDMFNIKLARVGGLCSAGIIHAMAERQNVPCMLGSYIESPLGALAGYHFVRSHDVVAADIGAWDLLENPPPSGLKNENGYMTLEGAFPGLGYGPAMERVLEQAFKGAP
jgi:L-alanine-DL-glutamate epimerase-like enolase superfamily enzyme